MKKAALCVQHSPTGVFLCEFSSNSKLIFKILQSQKLKLWRTVTLRPQLFCCAPCIYDSCQACQSLSGFLCVCAQCTSVMNVCIPTLWHLDAPPRSLRESDEEEKCRRDGMREMWAETSREKVQMLKRSGAWKGGSSAERRKGKDGWDGSFG